MGVSNVLSHDSLVLLVHFFLIVVILRIYVGFGASLLRARAAVVDLVIVRVRLLVRVHFHVPLSRVILLLHLHVSLLLLLLMQVRSVTVDLSLLLLLRRHAVRLLLLLLLLRRVIWIGARGKRNHWSLNRRRVSLLRRLNSRSRWHTHPPYILLQNQSRLTNALILLILVMLRWARLRLLRRRLLFAIPRFRRRDLRGGTEDRCEDVLLVARRALQLPRLLLGLMFAEKSRTRVRRPGKPSGWVTKLLSRCGCSDLQPRAGQKARAEVLKSDRGSVAGCQTLAMLTKPLKPVVSAGLLRRTSRLIETCLRPGEHVGRSRAIVAVGRRLHVRPRSLYQLRIAHVTAAHAEHLIRIVRYVR